MTHDWGDRVPAETAVRRRSVPNQPSERLHRRSAWLWARIHSGDHDWSRMQFAYRAAELRAIELELVRRAELRPSDRRTADA
jgi:hypothetical protein